MKTLLALGLLALGAAPALAANKVPVVPARVESAIVQNLPKTKTVILTVRAGNPDVNDGYNFNNATDGEKKFVVPLGWQVIIRFYNAGVQPHSLIVIPRPGDAGGAPDFQELYTVDAAAFPGSAHKIVVTGSGAYGGNLVFRASKTGPFLIVCGRMNHARNGQYVGFEVSGNAKEAEWR